MMQSGAIVRFGGVTAYGDEFRGAGFHLVDLGGWVESPDVRTEDVQRPAGHGRFTFPAFLRERVVPMSGFHVAATTFEQWHDAARLRGLLLTMLTLAVETPSGTLWARGKVTEATYAPLGFVPEGQWRVVVECDDPLVYGESRDFPAGATAVHYGNHAATPRLMIGAGSGGYTVTGPDGKLIVVSAAPSAAHEIDFTNGGLYLGGVRQTGAITTYQPWKVGPGLPGAVATITGSRSLVQRVTDTYK